MKWALFAYLALQAAYQLCMLVDDDKDAQARAASVLVISVRGGLAYWLYMSSGLFG